jgi:hypothetical protein
MSAPLCLGNLSDFLFGPFSLEIKQFSLKLYFIHNLVLEFQRGVWVPRLWWSREIERVDK